MKIKELKELRNKKVEELNSLLEKKRLEVIEMSVKIHKNAKVLKKEIAQIMTIIREKQI